MSMSKRQVYFVVYYDEADGSVVVDDSRAEAVFDKDDVWDDEAQKWSGMYEHAELFEKARQVVLDLVSTTWGGK